MCCNNCFKEIIIRTPYQRTSKQLALWRIESTHFCVSNNLIRKRQSEARIFSQLEMLWFQKILICEGCFPLWYSVMDYSSHYISISMSLFTVLVLTSRHICCNPKKKKYAWKHNISGLSKLRTKQTTIFFGL